MASQYLIHIQDIQDAADALRGDPLLYVLFIVGCVVVGALAAAIMYLVRRNDKREEREAGKVAERMSRIETRIASDYITRSEFEHKLESNMKDIKGTLVRLEERIEERFEALFNRLLR